MVLVDGRQHALYQKGAMNLTKETYSLETGRCFQKQLPSNEIRKYKLRCHVNKSVAVDYFTNMKDVGAGKESLILWSHLCSYEPRTLVSFHLYDIRMVRLTNRIAAVGLHIVNGTLAVYPLQCWRGFLLIGRACVHFTVAHNSGINETVSPAYQRVIDELIPHLLVKNIQVDISCIVSLNHKLVYGVGCDMFDSLTVLPETLLDTRCLDSQYRCRDGHCISEYWLYDGHIDCPDGSDEDQKQSGCIMGKSCDLCKPRACDCGSHYYQCHAGGCVHWDRVCDKINDCSDKSDEVMCTTHHYNDDNNIADIYQCDFQCLNSTVCLPTSSVNDLIPDCPLADDEDFDTGDVSCHLLDHVPCVPGHPRCFPVHQLCVYDLYPDGSMRYCRNGAHLTLCVGYDCPTKYKCPGSYCIPSRRVCDQVFDCPEGEDEDGCPLDQPLQCPGFFRCRQGPCIHPHEVCDGKVDCVRNGEDEWNCKRSSCPDGCECLGGSIACFITPQSLHLQQRSSFISLGPYQLPQLQLANRLTNIQITGAISIRLGSRLLSGLFQSNISRYVKRSDTICA